MDEQRKAKLPSVTLSDCCRAPVYYDAWAQYNEETKLYELSGTFDYNICSECGGEHPDTFRKAGAI